MPDLRPITESFPWLAIRNRPVFDGVNARQTFAYLTDSHGVFLTDDHGNRFIVFTGTTIGDLYRYA